MSIQRSTAVTVKPKKCTIYKLFKTLKWVTQNIANRIWMMV